MILIQDTRQKENKPVRVAVEGGAHANGNVVRMQALPYGDYCKMNPDIEWIFNDAIEGRMEDLKSKPAEADLIQRYTADILHNNTGIIVNEEQARNLATKLTVEFDQWCTDRTWLIRGKLTAVKKEELIGLYPAAVETKWRLAELDGCINSRNFARELRMARVHGCQMLVLVITDRPEDYYMAKKIQSYMQKVGEYGAILDICPEDEAFARIADYLEAPANYRRKIDEFYNNR